ncbi:MAG: hemin uptake protein HemP [Mariniblastus sp.]|nr:hemin uptake protein HemP [Mariniblastus sp.]
MSEPPPTNSGDQDPQNDRRVLDETKLPKIVQFKDLAVCGDEIWIENNGQLYRLRQTKQGKLILTK